MRIALLSRKPRLYSTSRLVEAAVARGHEIDVIDPIACVLVIARGTHRMIYRGEEVAGYDVVIPRIGASITDYGLAVLAHFERHGVPAVNSQQAIARSRDKLRALQSLSAHDINIPRTAMARDAEAIRAAVTAVGGVPVIIKLLQGTQGVGVMIADSAQAVESTLDTLWGLGQNIILQEFVAESRGRDLRAIVVGGELVGAMRRIARAGEFRSNLHRGGAGQAVELDGEAARIAVAAARELGLDVAGVDMLEARGGPLVIEVNSSPGLRGIESATSVDVAERIIQHAERIVDAAHVSARVTSPVRATRGAPRREIGWCEHVGLPDLGVPRLKAKIDTGARTSALHVTAMRPVGDSAAGRALLDIEVPTGVHHRLGKNRTRAVRVEVVEWTMVRASGGHAVRRPVIETRLVLGGSERQVRVSLTDRGDMLFPMLVGRTALGTEFHVAPHRRFVLDKKRSRARIDT